MQRPLVFQQGSGSRSNAWWSRRRGVPRRGWRLARCSSHWWDPDIEKMGILGNIVEEMLICRHCIAELETSHELDGLDRVSPA